MWRRFVVALGVTLGFRPGFKIVKKLSCCKRGNLGRYKTQFKTVLGHEDEPASHKCKKVVPSSVAIQLCRFTLRRPLLLPLLEAFRPPMQPYNHCLRL